MMKKLKLFMLVLVLMVGGVKSAWAYTTTDLTNAGWTLVTNFASLTLSDNYFVFVEAQEGKYTMSNAMPKGIGADGVRRPVFQAIANPFSVSGQVWAIENYGEGTYAVKSIADGFYLTSNGSWWSSHICSGKSDDSYIQITYLNDGKYRLRSTKQAADAYWGPYNDSPTVDLTKKDGLDLDDDLNDKDYASLAANKSTTNAPGFYLYAMSRTTYDANRCYSGALENGGWTKVTSTDGLGLSGYYYAFLDASENGGESGYAMTGTGGRPVYKPLANPISTTTQLWTTEKYGSGYAIKNVSDNKYIYSAASWNMDATASLTANAEYRPTVNAGLWTLSSVTSTSEFVGNYKNSPYNPNEDGKESNPGELASNKAAGKGRRAFIIYSIPTIAGVVTALPGTGIMTADTWYSISGDATKYISASVDINDIVYTTNSSDLYNVAGTAIARATIETGTTYYIKSSSNQTITFNAKSDLALAEGTYFFKVAAAHNGTEEIEAVPAGKYLSRGGSWSTHATLDDYGLPIKVDILPNGKYTLSPCDTKDYFHHRNTYDCLAHDYNTSGATNNLFDITASNGKLVIGNTCMSGKYLKYDTSSESNSVISVWDDGTGTNSGPYILWTVETPSEHATAMTTLKNTRIAATATTASASANYSSLSGITSESALETELSTYYLTSSVVAPSDYSVVGDISELYQGAQSVSSPATIYSNTVEISEAGLYKFSMKAFYRAANNNVTQAMHTAGTDFPPVILFFGSAERQLKSLYDETGLASFESGSSVEYNGKKYANDKTTALAMFKADLYDNDVYLYISTPGTYSYGIKYMGWAGANSQWVCYVPKTVSITTFAPAEITISEDDDMAATARSYSSVTLTRTLSSSYWNTFSVPFDMDIPEGWVVKEFSSASDNVINFTTALTIVAGKPYLVKPESDVENPTFNGVTVQNTEGSTDGDDDYKFAAQIYNKSLATDGTIAYLATDGTLKKLTSGGIKGLRAYFIIPAGGSARIAFTDGDEPTGINEVKTQSPNGNIYDLSGRRVENMKKGIYVVNGKKVVK